MFFTDPTSGDLVVVHELAHQWTGDLLRVDLWQRIWLNEGFATYAEWLWQEREGLTPPQQVFDDIAATAPPEFWDIAIGDPGPATEDLFDIAVYFRGAMTLQALRTTVGDDVFFAVLREWVRTQAGGTVTTGEFVALAERFSGGRPSWDHSRSRPPPAGLRRLSRWDRTAPPGWRARAHRGRSAPAWPTRRTASTRTRTRPAPAPTAARGRPR